MTPEQQAAIDAARDRLAAKKSDRPSKLYENIVGYGAVDTPGERLGELIRGGTAAVARGMADVPALPANLAQLAAQGVEKLTGMEEPSAVSRGLAALPETREMLAAVPGIGPESQYVAPGRAGEVISTVGEFAGGAGLGGGAKTMLRYGVAPGAAYEAAGELAPDSALKPYIQAGAALAAPLVAGKIVSPLGGADPELVAAASRARQMGIKPTAGQATGSGTLQSLEGSLAATDQQLDQLTSAALKTVGSRGVRATTDALNDAQRGISNEFNRILSGVSVTPQQSFVQRAKAVLDDYISDAPANTVTPRIQKIADEIEDAASTAAQIDLTVLRKWRTKLGGMLSSKDEALRNAARSMQSVVDDMTDAALVAAGNVDDVAALSNARRQWYNLLTLKDAMSRAGQPARLGRLTPESLRGAVSRVQGKDAISMGRGTELADLARTAEAAIPTVPTVSPGGARTFSPEMISGGAGMITGGPIGAAAGVAGSQSARAVLQNPAVQAYLRNQLMDLPTSGGMAATLPGLLSQQ